MNEAYTIWESIHNDYERWKKDNHAPYAMTNMIENMKKLAEIVKENPFAEKKQEEARVAENASTVPNEDKPVVVTAVREQKPNHQTYNNGGKYRK